MWWIFWLLILVCRVRNWLGWKLKVLCIVVGMLKVIVIELVVLGFICLMVSL